MKPTGLVTFLFTDIEGSTKLSQEFPDTLPVALERHHSIMQSAIESNNGFVFEIIGDAFCAAFENADDAVNAAFEAQLNLSNEKWKDAVIKVRIGIHSGNVEWNGKSYMGYITLARTARVMSAAYGEQILISNDAYELCKYKFVTEKERDISFRDLGERRLKDVIQPIRLYQITEPGLRKDFPPLKTLDARPNNLPVQLTSFIGREKEISDIKKILINTKLITLFGPGGTGKTRLSLQVGADVIDDFENGVWIVELASLIDPLLLPQAVVQALGLKEQPGQNPEDTISEYLKTKEILIIFDNCEHIINVCSHLTEKLLRNSPKLKIIATSREALNCSGEIAYKVPSLSLPDIAINHSPEGLSQYGAVRLFIERALAVNHGFRVNNENAPFLAQICYQLDGIPLALELAAVRCKILSLEQICEKLSDRFKLLTGGKRTALPRQQTLKALIDWSYDLLSDKEKIIWSRLSVFTGGWTLEASEEICSDEYLSPGDVLDLTNGLIEKSIVFYSEENDKYKMLETIKQYGNERLKESGEKENFENKHLNYFLNLCEGAITEYSGPNARNWLDKVEEFYPNIQSALNWSVENNLKDAGNRIAVSMGKFWELRGHFTEGRSWFEKLLKDSENISPEIIASSKTLASILAVHQGEYEISQKYLEDALEFYRKSGNKNGIGNCLNNLGLNYYDMGNFEKSKSCLNEGLQLRREVNHRLGICSTLNSLGLVILAEGDFINAKKYFEESLQIAIELKDKMYIGIGYSNLAQIYQHFEDYKTAEEYFEKGLSLDRELGNKSGICVSLYNLGLVALEKKEYSSAIELLEESLELSKEIGYIQSILYSLSGLGQVAIAKKDFKNAEKIFKECLSLQKDYVELQAAAACLLGIAEIKNLDGKYELAVNLISAIKSKYQSVGAFLENKYQIHFDDILNSIIVSFGEQKTNEAVQKGNGMTFEKAIEIAVNS